MAAKLDPRRNVYRADLAATALKGRIEAAKFVEPRSLQVCVPVLDLLADPDAPSLASQLLFGEVFDVYESSDGVAWGQNRTDMYVGYLPSNGLCEITKTDQMVTATLAHVYPEPTFKSTPSMQLPFGSAISVVGETGGFLESPYGFLSKRHLEHAPTDFVTASARYLNTPYLWGGRSALGLDCSALVQLGLQAIGVTCPRDSDMQMKEIGEAIVGPYLRGDLVFWKGHVGIMFDESTLLHANVYHMCVALEPIADAKLRISKSDGPVIMHKRITL